MPDIDTSNMEGQDEYFGRSSNRRNSASQPQNDDSLKHAQDLQALANIFAEVTGGTAKELTITQAADIERKMKAAGLRLTRG